MRVNKEYQAMWSHWLKIIIIETAHFPPTAAFQKLIINNFDYWNCMKQKSDETICEFINFRTTCRLILRTRLERQRAKHLERKWAKHVERQRTKHVERQRAKHVERDGLNTLSVAG